MATWIYNNPEGNIIFHITPELDNVFTISKKQFDIWMQSYKPFLIRIIPKDVAQEWLNQIDIESAQKIEPEKNSLTYFQVFDAMILFLQTYAPDTESLQELLRYLHAIQHDQKDDHWRAWLLCIDHTICTPDSCIYAESL